MRLWLIKIELVFPHEHKHAKETRYINNPHVERAGWGGVGLGRSMASQHGIMKRLAPSNVSNISCPRSPCSTSLCTDTITHKNTFDSQCKANLALGFVFHVSLLSSPRFRVRPPRFNVDCQVLPANVSGAQSGGYEDRKHLPRRKVFAVNQNQRWKGRGGMRKLCSCVSSQRTMSCSNCQPLH